MPANNEFNKTPKIEYSNPDPKNEMDSAIIRIPNEIWLMVLSHLDIKSLIFTMLSCKNMANLTNDDEVRARLYKAKVNHYFFKAQQVPSTPIESFVDRSSALSRLIPSYSNKPTNVLHPHKARQLYNNNPPGRGFIMK